MKITVTFPLVCAMLVALSNPLQAQDTLITNYPDSKKVWEKLFEDGQKIKETIYYENGQVWMTASYDENKDEIWNWFYENGQLAESLNFVDDLEQGRAKFWHLNGKLAAVGEYKDGKMVGDWSFKASDGAPANGEWTWKFAALNQFTRMEGLVENGKRVGSWTYRSTSGYGKSEQLVFVDDF